MLDFGPLTGKVVAKITSEYYLDPKWESDDNEEEE